MLETGSINRLPAKYRMFLALSVALLVHALIAAGLSQFAIPQTQRQNSSLNVILVRSGHDAGTTSPASTASSPSTEPLPVTQPEVITGKSQLTTRQGPDTAPEPARPETRPDPTPQQALPQAVAPEPDDRHGARSPIEGAADNAITQITPPTASHAPSYSDTLILQIAKEAGRETLQIPKQTLRQGLQPLQLELKLMPNGTLVRADVIKSTGIQAYDQSILRAALRASPFPEPPGDAGSSSLQFRITFYLEPGR